MKKNRKKEIKHKIELLKFKLIKSKIYDKSDTLPHNHFIESIEGKLKKVLRLIYKYHSRNKKILFVGMPLKLDEKVQGFLKKTNHKFLPEGYWMNGMFTNKFSSLQYAYLNQKIVSKKRFGYLTLLVNKPDLVVILNPSTEGNNIMKESLKVKIPTVHLNTAFEDRSNEIIYKVPGNYSYLHKESQRSFFYWFFLPIFKKAEKERIAYKISKKKKPKPKKKFHHKKKRFYK